MPESTVTAAYGARSDEYTSLFGDIASAHPDDRALVAEWARGLDGPVVDLGCGPGQWTDFLHAHGAEISGVDPTPEFVAIARSRHPQLEFRAGDARRLDLPGGSVAGVLAWYSLIHLAPDELTAALAEIARVLRPGGALLVGFFDGGEVEQFAHAVAPAWFWPPERLGEELDRAGFRIEEVVRRRTAEARPHAAVVARRAG
ncbi:class I SAM-dependent methyltransferase [Microbacterium rhizophilus]|uniref:class I SAM-dependent methyltransferase n=1 Tax=Microbacterium rhizophilus TaxID=3138934 RepID=UPI0031ED0A30